MTARDYDKYVHQVIKRSHEVRGLLVGNVRFDAYGAVALFRSTKSNDSNVRLILSAKALQGWLEIHGDRKNADAYVFYGMCGRSLSEERFRDLLRQAAKKANIKRRVWPHLLRHSRIAVLKRKNLLTDADIMNITGHQDRRQLDRYGKITMTMTNDKLLQIQGLVKEEQEREKPKARSCRRCGFVNGPLSQYCGRCTLPLDENVVLKHDKLVADLELLLRLPGAEEMFAGLVEQSKQVLSKIVKEKHKKG